MDRESYQSDYDDDSERRGRRRPTRRSNQNQRSYWDGVDDWRGRSSSERSRSLDEDQYQDFDDNQEYEEDEYDYEREGRRSGGRRGFAAMDPEQQRSIARRGGQASSRSQSRDDYGQFQGQGRYSGNYDRYDRENRGFSYDPEEDYDYRDYRNQSQSRRGYSSMDRDDRRRGSSRGGRSRNS